MSTEPGTSLNKVYGSAMESLAGLQDGASLLIGGLAGHGEPEGLLEAVIASGARALTVISQGAGAPPRRPRREGRAAMGRWPGQRATAIAQGAPVRTRGESCLFSVGNRGCRRTKP